MEETITQSDNEHWYQCDQIWRNFAILAKSSRSSTICEALFTIWEYLGPTLSIFYAIGHVFIDINDQMLKKNLAIWSH